MDKTDNTQEKLEKKYASFLPFVPEMVVVGNGEFPVHPLPLSVLDKATFVVCCDGGTNALVASGRVPDLIVGDGDSLSEENRSRFQSLLYVNPDQETNDQTKAVSWLAARGIRRLALLAATGKREDHTLGNISLLLEYQRMGLEVVLLTDYGYFLPAEGNREFAGFPGQQVSVFNFGATCLKSRGLRYPIYDFTAWWQGTLNEVTGASFSISAEGAYLVYGTYEPK